MQHGAGGNTAQHHTLPTFGGSFIPQALVKYTVGVGEKVVVVVAVAGVETFPTQGAVEHITAQVQDAAEDNHTGSPAMQTMGGVKCAASSWKDCTRS